MIGALLGLAASCGLLLVESHVRRRRFAFITRVSAALGETESSYLQGLKQYASREIDQITRWFRVRSLHLAHRKAMTAEFPAIAELLALAVVAGVGLVGALDRVASLASGPLAAELRRLVGDIRAGTSLTDALDALAERTDLKPITRFAVAVSTAVERGTPLAEVLRAHASDAHDASHRALLEAAGRKELLMLIPVVFLLLPITVIFAIYPTLTTLRIGF